MDKKAIEAIRKFLASASKNFNIKKVIFFGSRTGKNYMEHSDVDLIVVSDDFEGIDFDKRMKLMQELWNGDYAVDFLCYTFEEFAKLSKRITLVRDAVKKGIHIK